ncbi:hypothetical protein Mkiyose1665_20020 [Mycobacterium kiyosense]|uniref:DJ-1/PfpI domain-containing protein n=1 Tax=Mycobacterium kiyosense TaxID=2871094 RepID=A0A9P3UXY5_9MYCO|nr:hypothetical protein IWGMT90018_00690 [Mycobacterium kiyosense]BDE11485.1 hypothetical protein MKCMC460_03450 [Mycobacterium sp. 20KCMC460]GLB82429.1 hypothetical protein SRL2020028_16850 [Mycobacterium kiyosense]GLB88864.1 hypothetical protein SRL2020130_16810 [Mycobacterium kiyosense]GLB95644.1 hypothetical protein SRL2020226_24200 [Mycobacterium kiyosense]
MRVAIPVFPRFTALDAIGPYEVLQRIPSVDVVFVGHERGEVRTENNMLGVRLRRHLRRGRHARRGGGSRGHRDPRTHRR